MLIVKKAINQSTLLVGCIKCELQTSVCENQTHAATQYDNRDMM